VVYNVLFGDELLLPCLDLEELLINILLVGTNLLGVVPSHIEASK
jgi:hypothetical protein